MNDLKFLLKGVFIYIPALLFVVIGSFLLQYELLDPLPGYRAFAAAGARVGQAIVFVAAIILVLGLAAIVIYQIRQGTTGDSEGSGVEEGPLPMDVDINFGRSQRKILVQRSVLISMKSLVRGTATIGERLLVLGGFVWLASFFSIFLGIGLILAKGLAIMALVPVIPGIFICARFLRPAWKDYREAKAELRGMPVGHRAK